MEPIISKILKSAKVEIIVDIDWKKIRSHLENFDVNLNVLGKVVDEDTDFKNDQIWYEIKNKLKGG